MRYRGYPIEELAGEASYLDVAHLVLYGELPNQKQSAEWESLIMQNAVIPKGIENVSEAPLPSHTPSSSSQPRACESPELTTDSTMMTWFSFPRPSPPCLRTPTP